MKIAVSSYSFSQYIRDGRLTQLTCIAKAKELGKPVHTLPEPGRVAELLIQSISQKYNMTGNGQQDKQPKAAESEQHNDE